MLAEGFPVGRGEARVSNSPTGRAGAKERLTLVANVVETHGLSHRAPSVRVAGPIGRRRGSRMTPEEKFMFDLDGYLLIKNVLTKDEVAELNAIADEKFPRPPDHTTGQRTSRVSRWGPAYQ